MSTRAIIVSVLALLAHTPASARGADPVQRPRTTSACAGCDAPTGTVTFADLNLAHPAGAAALRRRIDTMVIALSGGDVVRNRPEVRVARSSARAQADALIAAARLSTPKRA